MATHSWWANTRESESCPAISAGVLTNYPGVGHKRIPGSKSLQGIPGLICISTSVIRKSRSRNRPVVKNSGSDFRLFVAADLSGGWRGGRFNW
ncbi:hypothetical protein CEXT_35921 [Caerostris extrusa]|uniref:Uncharacterized protein n=1 Tax=Caerostris extrusa TaxID=172846 RepID=A0AAV4MGS4_CAEEX|nr:hypothetical protein CEXT_35921 [Caerostris extrusa]